MSARRRILLLGAAAGVTGAVAWLPVHLAFVMPLMFFLAARALRQVRTGREAVLLGVVFGAVRYAIASHFLFALLRYSSLSIVFYVLVIVYILPFAILETWVPFRLGKRGGLPRSVGLVLMFALMEKARTLGDLSFPADLVAHAFGSYPGFLGWAPWIGPFGVTMVAGGAGILLEAGYEHRHRSRRGVGLAVAGLLLWLAPMATHEIERAVTGGKASAMNVGIVQPSVRLDQKIDPATWPDVWATLERLTLEAARGADLVVWPETSRPGPVIWKNGGAFTDPPMEALARRVGVPILYGCEIARVSGDVTRLYNGAALVRPDGATDWYGKQRLLPFVEGVPFADLLGWDPSERTSRKEGAYLTMLGNFSPGPRPTVFRVGQARIGVLICYEGFYPQLVRRFREEGANALAVITNDAWWGRSIFAKQHALLVSARCREAGVPFIRAANSGVSSASDRFGRLSGSTDLFEVTTLAVDLAPATDGPTFYARYGDLVLWAALLVILGAVGRGLLRPGASAETAPPTAGGGAPAAPGRPRPRRRGRGKRRRQRHA